MTPEPQQQASAATAHPLPVGARVVALSKAGGQGPEEPHPCDVIERRAQHTEGAEDEWRCSPAHARMRAPTC